MRVLVFTGKGGVGKTTHTLATALGAAAHGHRVFLLSTDPAHSLGDALGRPVGARAVEVAPGVVAQEVKRPGGARPLLVARSSAGCARCCATAPTSSWRRSCSSSRASRSWWPCARCARSEATGEFDVCIVDCAPTGATLRMLRFPDALRIFMENFFELERRGVRAAAPARRSASRPAGFVPREEFFEAFERLYGEVEDVRQILLDETRTSARLVVNPARVVVDETRRSFAYLCLYGVATDAVIVNRVLPARRRGRLVRALGGERARGARGDRGVVPGADPARAAPAARGARRGRRCAPCAEVYGERDPAERFARARPFRLVRAGGRQRARDRPARRARRRRSRSPPAATSSSCGSATPSAGSRSRPRWRGAPWRAGGSRRACSRSSRERPRRAAGRGGGRAAPRAHRLASSRA